MKWLRRMAERGVERVIALSEPGCGLRGFIVVDDTSRGRTATGGIRLFPFGSEEEALEAAERKLARARGWRHWHVPV